MTEELNDIICKVCNEIIVQTIAYVDPAIVDIIQKHTIDDLENKTSE